MPSRHINVERTGKWSFTLDGGIHRSKRVLTEGEEVVLSTDVTNDGLEIGTAYVRTLIARSLHLRTHSFDSHRDLPLNAQLGLRLVDIPVGGSRRVACPWSIPVGSAGIHFDVRMQIWNPHLLSNGPRPYMFFDTGWEGGFYVVGPLPAGSPKAFISYSWDGEEHKAWVHRLADELRKHGIEYVLDTDHSFAGDELTRFIERGLRDSTAVILICTENYTKKANARRRGVGFETIIYSQQYLRSSPLQRARFIPIVRSNSLKNKLPTYLGSAKYIDMSGDDWQAGPMLELERSIQRHQHG